MDASTAQERPQRTEREGMPVWWADVPGPFTASMIFRVGQADEPLAMRGVTHLVEHLALFPIGRPEYEYNGFVDDVRCVLFARGERDEVLEFLRRTSAALGDLPLDRLDLERRVLRAEAGPGDALSRLRAFRYGGMGYGLTNYHELGLRYLGPDQVSRWAAERFTRGNVTLWMTGEPPEDLGLDLPDGSRCAPPSPEPIVLQYPAFVAEGTGGVVLSATGRRSTSMRVLESVGGERLYDRIRRDRGMGYAPYGSYQTLGASTAHLVLASDCQDADAPVVMDELWRTVREICADGVTEDELDRYRRSVARMLAEPEALRGELDNRASDELMGVEVYTRESWLAELESLSPSAVASAAEEVAASAILLGPTGSSAPAGGGFCPYAMRTPEPVSGDEHAAHSGLDEWLRVGERGMTYRAPAGDESTIEWSTCPAAELRPDLSLVVHAREGGWLTLASSEWVDGEALVDRVQRALDPALVIPCADPRVAGEVSRFAAEHLDNPQRVGAALAGVAADLGEGEELADMAVAEVDGVPGLLTVTDRRVLWIGREETRDVPLADLREVKVPRLSLRDAPIEIVAEHGTVAALVKPMKRARALAAEIERRAGR